MCFKGHSLRNVPHLGVVGATASVDEAWVVNVGAEHKLDPAVVVRVRPGRHKGLGVHEQFAESLVQLVQHVLTVLVRQ